MTELLDWLTKYSPAVVLLIAFGASLLFVTKLIVEKSIASEFDEKSKVFEALLKRRSAFEEKVLSDRFVLIAGLSARLERVMTNLILKTSSPEFFRISLSEVQGPFPMVGLFS